MTNTELLLVIKARDSASAILNDVSKNAGSLGGKLGGALKVGAIAGAAGVSVLAAGLAGCVKDAIEAQEVLAQTEAVIKSTGGAAGLNAKEISAMAGELSRVTKFSDDTIQSAQNVLLTFTKVGKDAFPTATKAMLDMSTALGTDLQSSAILVGKALNDPIAGVTALGRSGVQFTVSQKEMIASLVAAGDQLGAQKIVLAELETQFGGSAKAAGETFGGKMAILKNQIGEVKESIGMALLPMLTELATKMSTFLTEHQGDIDKFIALMGEKVPEAIADIRAAFEEARPFLENVFKQMKEGFEVLQPSLQWVIDNKPALVTALVVIGAAMLLAFTPVTLPILAVIAAIGAVMFILGTSKEEWLAYGAVLSKLWEDIQKVITEKLGIIGVVVVYYMDTIRNYVQTAILVVRDIITIVMALIRGDWSAAWDGVRQLLNTIWDGIVTDIGLKVGLVKDIVFYGFEVAKNLGVAAFNALKTTVIGVWKDIKREVGEAIDSILGKINSIKGPVNKAIDLYNALPGRDLPLLAAGVRNFAGGLAIVGEQGPELVALPHGANVYSNRESRDMANAGGTTIVNNYTIYVDRQEIHGSGAADLAAAMVNV